MCAVMVCYDASDNGKSLERRGEEEPCDENMSDETAGKVKSKRESWNLAWYECFLAFESKQRVRRANQKLRGEETEDEEAHSDDENDVVDEVVVPVEIAKQLEIVKLQMTEYIFIRGKLEKTKRRNDQLEKRIAQIDKSLSELKKESEEKISIQDEKIKKVCSQVGKARKETEKVAKMISTSKINEKMYKKSIQDNAEELKMLREQHGPQMEKSLRVSSTGKNLWAAVSSVVRLNDNDENSTNSHDEHSANYENKKNLLNFLVKNLQHEEWISQDFDDGGSIKSSNFAAAAASSQRARSRRSVSSQCDQKTFGKKYNNVIRRSNSNVSAGLFRTVLPTFHEDKDIAIDDKAS